MTLGSTSSTEVKNGNGTTTSWSFTFVIDQNSDLVVTKTNSSGVETTLVEGTGTANYSVTISDYPGTGSITYPATLGTKLANGESLTLQRTVDLDQQTDLVNQGAWNPSTVERSLDYARMVDIQQQDEINRSIKTPASDSSGASYTLPSPSSGKVIGVWNSDGNAIEVGPDASQITAAEAQATAAAASASAASASESNVDADVTAFYGAFDVTSLGLNFVGQDYRWQEDDTISPVVAKTSAYSVLATDHDKIFDVTNTTTITLPAVATVANGYHVTVRNADTNLTTIDASGSETIKSVGENTGVQNFTMRFYGQSVKLVNNGSLWIAEHNMQPLVPIRAITGTYSIVWSDNGYTLDASNAFTFTLPVISTVPAGFNVKIRCKDDNNLKTIQRAGSDTISFWGDTGSTSVSMSEIGDWIEIVSDGSLWIATGNVAVTLRYYTDWPTPTPVAVTTATSTKVLFDTLNKDTHSGWNAGNYYVIPFKGVYEVHSWVAFEPLAAHDFEAEMWLFTDSTSITSRTLNTVKHVAADTSYSDHVVLEIHGFWSADVGDHWGIAVKHNYGSNINIHPAASSANNNYLSIRRVGNN